MRFRPANIRLINRRSNLPRLLLALSLKNDKSNCNDQNNPTDSQELTGSPISNTLSWSPFRRYTRNALPECSVDGRRGAILPFLSDRYGRARHRYSW